MPETLNLPNSSFCQVSAHLCLITFPLSPHPSPSPVDSCWIKQWVRCLLLNRRLIATSDPGTIWIFALTQTEKASFFFHVNTNLIWLLLLSGNSRERQCQEGTKLLGSRLMFGAGFSAECTCQTQLWSLYWFIHPVSYFVSGLILKYLCICTFRTKQEEWCSPPVALSFLSRPPVPRESSSAPLHGEGGCPSPPIYLTPAKGELLA